jgi:hypothetical protein
MRRWSSIFVTVALAVMRARSTICDWHFGHWSPETPRVLRNRAAQGNLRGRTVGATSANAGVGDGAVWSVMSAASWSPGFSSRAKAVWVPGGAWSSAAALGQTCVAA